MSFILDALRKSESERQQEARPNIARIPDAVPQRRLPAWALGTMTLLAAGVIVLGVAWWRSTQMSTASTMTPMTATADAPRATPLPIPRPQRDSADAPLRDEVTHGQPRSTLRAAAESRAASSTAPSTTLAEAAGDGSASGRSPRVAAADVPAIDPLLQRYTAGDGNLPPLRLELHAYDDAPASRFVFINGSRYAEGDTLNEGPRLIAITPDGAVLLSGDQQFLLGQE